MQETFFILLLGMPAAGKSALAPVLNAAVCALRRHRSLSLQEIDAALDKFLEGYRCADFASSACDRFALAAAKTDWPDCVRAALQGSELTIKKDDLQSAESEDYPSYRDQRGNIKRALSSNATAWCIHRLLS